MARRSFRRSRSVSRVATEWVTGSIDASMTAVASGVLTEIPLFVPGTVVRPVTIVRVVGSIYVLPQTAGNVVVNWMIYRQFGTTTLDPSSSVDLDNEEIMMHRQVPFNALDTLIPGQSTAVDVKAQRRISPGEHTLVLSIRATSAYRFAVALRVLLRESRG